MLRKQTESLTKKLGFSITHHCRGKMNEIGRVLMIAGAGMFVMGLLIVVAGRFAWFGQLPGDIVVKRESFTFFAPIGSMIVISVLLTIVLNVIGRLFR